jgi:hypothetical protein
VARTLRVAWFVVLAMMLAAAAWSISSQLITWGMNRWLAYGISLMFDASSLICAEYARRAITRGTPAGLPRLSILAFASVAGVMNYHHGHSVGGTPAGIAFASTSFLVELLFELNRRDVRDTERHQRGLVPEMLPRVPLIAWIMFPVRSWSTLREAVGVRLDTLDPVASTHRDAGTRATGTVRAAVLAAATTMPGASHDELADKLARLGIDVDEDDVRDILATTRDSETGQGHRRSTRQLSVVPRQHQNKDDDSDEDEDTIAGTVRRCVRDGVTDLGRVLSAVRQVHGQGVRRATVRKSLDRACGRTAS